MFFFFICGEHTFRSEIPGYEGMVCQCHHCGNMAAHVVKSRPFFTFCFVPLENRPDVMAMANRGGGGGNQGGGQHGPPPPQGGQQRYG
ncbi:hypothetical protein MAA_00535 [Metarhizium robertsii ARSEF 23]|uniref:Uncharacterized protein n=1 Tax=Metarhizium robertsii (strain ARSEF 23 / ATCC MYA-3075) TaxID=655844 RepID=E9EKR1_METRA|nr:uncharacterized protein MAA_00535 [Metarhizium robertsii ARSEF 23]EFZ03461.1 hypothetical protein MAA_00535 [Metarhizium robertsii ARSEF 23]